jgi:hypothetical protein
MQQHWNMYWTMCDHRQKVLHAGDTAEAHLEHERAQSHVGQICQRQHLHTRLFNHDQKWFRRTPAELLQESLQWKLLWIESVKWGRLRAANWTVVFRNLATLGTQHTSSYPLQDH